MIYSVVERNQFSRQGWQYFGAAARAERAFLQADPFQRRIASAWFHKFAIVCRPTIPGPLPRGRGSEGSRNKPLAGRMDDRHGV